jgi:hypothetical protein
VIRVGDAVGDELVDAGHQILIIAAADVLHVAAQQGVAV